jgi:hypothetical protein
MVIVAINKTDHELTANLDLSGAAGAISSAELYQLTAASPNPQPAGHAVINDRSRMNCTMPAYGVITISVRVGP